MARFDCAIWRPINANTGGKIGPNLGLILHHAVAYGSLFSFFNKPSAQVSAHFWVALDGTIEQYVDSETVAWHGKSLNSRYVGVETEGCTQATNYAEPMTPAMVNALARIYAEGHRRHGWPFILSGTDGAPGFGYHRMAVNTACPCDIRLNRRQDILNIAQGQQPTPVPPEEPDIDEEEITIMTSDVVKYRFNEWAFFQATNGQLWQKYSQDQGLTWKSKALIRPSGDPVKATVIDWCSAVVIDGAVVVTTEDVDGFAWVCRLPADVKQGWDIRRVA